MALIVVDYSFSITYEEHGVTKTAWARRTERLPLQNGDEFKLQINMPVHGDTLTVPDFMQTKQEGGYIEPNHLLDIEPEINLQDKDISTL